MVDESTQRIDQLVKAGVIIMILKVSLSYTSSLYTKIIGDMNIIDNILTIIGSLVFFFAIIRNRYSVSNFILFITIGLITLYSVYCSGEYGLLITILTCLAAYKENFNSIIKFIFKFELVYFIAAIVISILLHAFLGVNISMSATTGQIRYFFGFNHPNTLAVYFFNLVVMWVWLYYFKKR